MGKGCHLEIHPLEILAITQLRQLCRRQCLERSSGDPVQSLELGVAGIDELDFDTHRLQQIELGQSTRKGIRFARAGDQHSHHRADVLQELGGLTVVLEQAFSVLRLHIWAAEVERQIEGRLCTRRRIATPGNQRERLTLDLQRDIARIPNALRQEEILAAVESQQRRRFEPSVFRAFGEEDRILRQEPREFARHYADDIAGGILGAGVPCGNAQRTMLLTVQDHQISHAPSYNPTTSNGRVATPSASTSTTWTTRPRRES